MKKHRSPVNCISIFSQTAITALEETDKRVRLIRTSSHRLLRVMDIHSDPGAEVQTEVAKVTHLGKNLKSSLKNKRSKLEKGLKYYNQFVEAVNEIEAWLPGARETAEAPVSASGEPDEIKEQLAAIKVRILIHIVQTKLFICLIITNVLLGSRFINMIFKWVLKYNYIYTQPNRLDLRDQE